MYRFSSFPFVPFHHELNDFFRYTLASWFFFFWTYNITLKWYAWISIFMQTNTYMHLDVSMAFSMDFSSIVSACSFFSCYWNFQAKKLLQLQKLNHKMPNKCLHWKWIFHKACVHIQLDNRQRNIHMHATLRMLCNRYHEWELCTSAIIITDKIYVINTF